MSRAANENRTTYTVVLVCHHALEFCAPVPKVGERLWCARCRRDQTVARSRADYAVRCRDCRYSRRYGQAKLTAETAATMHAQRKQGHRVRVMDGYTVISESSTRQPTLTDAPPPY